MIVNPRLIQSRSKRKLRKTKEKKAFPKVACGVMVGELAFTSSYGSRGGPLRNEYCFKRATVYGFKRALIVIPVPLSYGGMAEAGHKLRDVIFIDGPMLNCPRAKLHSSLIAKVLKASIFAFVFAVTDFIDLFHFLKFLQNLNFFSLRYEHVCHAWRVV